MGRRVAQAIGAVLGAGALVVACSAFSVADDGAASPADAQAIEGATEGDVSPGEGEDAARAGFCEGLSPAPTFCLDFDDGEPPGTGFSEPGDTESMSIDTLFFTSPPASLRIIGGTDSIMRRLLEEAPSSYEIRFQMRLGTSDGGIHVEPEFLIPVRFETSDCVVSLLLKGSGALEVVRSNVAPQEWTRGQLVRRPTPGAWSQIELRITRAPAGSVIALAIGGRPALENDLTTSCSLAGQPKLWFGLQYAQGVEARFDDLVVYAR